MPTQTKKAPTAATVDAPAKNTSPSILKLAGAVRQAQSVEPPLPVLSELLTDEDFHGFDAERHSAFILADEVFREARRDTVNRLKKELEVVYADADTNDLVLLTKSIRYWRRYHGDDRIQAGYLIAAILFNSGHVPQNQVQLRNSHILTARDNAKRRLNHASIPYLDDSDLFGLRSRDEERVEDDRIRERARIARKEAKAIMRAHRNKMGAREES